MHYSHEKYEFSLFTWGGFYNDEYKAIHKFEEGLFFFDSDEERTVYLNKLIKIENELKANHLVYKKQEGRHVRYITVVKVKFIYNKISYDIEHSFKNAYDDINAVYMFYKGSYSCDCNRIDLINEQHNTNFDSICGDTIEMKNFEIHHIKDYPKS